MNRLVVRLSIAAACVGASFAAPAQTPPAATPPGLTHVRQVEGIDEYRLDNGLQVLLVADDSKPTTTVNVTYRVGSRYEGYGETGMAHLLEHLIFKGTPTTKNVMGELSRRGLRFNGTTSFDRTNYFASFAASDDNLRWYLSWQADAMVNSLIARADLDSEMTVVRNEMERGENEPGSILVQRTLASMFDWHNYGKSVIGARSDVENVDIPSLQAFYRRYYQPDNATLIVAGRFDRARTLAWIGQSFGGVPRPGRVLRPTYTLDPAQDGERSVTVRRVGGTPIVIGAFHAPPAASPDYAAVELLAQVLGDTPGGRLHRRLVEPGLAAQAEAFAWDLAEPGLLVLRIGLAPGQDVARAREAMLETVDALAREPVTAQELERARLQWLNAWDKGFEDPERIGVEMSSAIGWGDWRLYFLLRDHVRQVTLESINRVAGENLKRDNRTVATYLPTARPERAPAPARADVARLVDGYKGDPALAAAAGFEPTPSNLDARTQSFTLASGLRVALIEKGARAQAVRARLRLRYGDVASLNGLETIAELTASMLDKGGAGLDRQQIADRFDQLQADVAFAASPQALDVTIATRRDRLPEVIRLLGGLLRRPDFPAAPFDEVKRQRLALIERQKQEPDARARRVVLGAVNPYPRGDVRHVSTFEEMEQELGAATLARVAEFQRRFYSAAGGDFAAVGDLDAGAVRAALEQAFGDWSRPAAGALPYARAPRPNTPVAGRRLVEITPDKQNANLYAALALPVGDNDADHAALLLANEIFGADTDSILWKRIRETEGLSYGVYSSAAWSAFDANSPWIVRAIFAPQNRGRVETALREELARSARDGFTQAELDRARVGVLEARRLRRAQDATVAAWLVDNGEASRRFAFQQRIDDALRALTLAEVNAAWRRYVRADAIVFGWGGDFKDAP